jgi:hypothetical protein
VQSPDHSKKQKPFSKHTKLSARLVGNVDGEQVDLQEFMKKVEPGTKWRVIMPSMKPLPEAQFQTSQYSPEDILRIPGITFHPTTLAIEETTPTVFDG